MGSANMCATSGQLTWAAKGHYLHECSYELQSEKAGKINFDFV